MVYSRAVRKKLSKKTSGRHGYTILLLVSEEKCPRFCFCRRPLLFFGHFLKTKRARKSVLEFVSVFSLKSDLHAVIESISQFDAFSFLDFRSAIVQYHAKVLNHLFFLYIFFPRSQTRYLNWPWPKVLQVFSTWTFSDRGCVFLSFCLSSIKRKQISSNEPALCLQITGNFAKNHF